MSAEPFENLEHKHVVIPVSDEEYRLRTEGPTEVERARWKREAEERKNREHQQRSTYTSRRLAATGVLRRIMDLHAPVGEGTRWYTCGVCYDGDYMGAHTDWPCETATLALEDDSG